MTQLEYAKNNIVTLLMKTIASSENIDPESLLTSIKEGKVVIPLNINKKHKIKKPCGIGLGLRTKINANIGTSTEKSKIAVEMKKLDIAVKYGADTVMDLSIGSDIKEMRSKIVKNSPVPVGTVPIYEIAVNAHKNNGKFLKFGADDILETLETQAREGVDFFTIHAGVTRRVLKALKKSPRILDIVSRGGAIIASWITHYKKENPFYDHFDKILDIAYRYDVTLSLGDGLRPGSIMDSTDSAQLAELKTLGELAECAKKKNVQVMIEGPGHVPLHQIEKNVLLEKKICKGSPFYILGPLVTDVASGYDHITAAIGGAYAASLGADFLCYVTPAEHLRLPSIEDVKEGVIASRIAAHAADLSKGILSAFDWDKKMSQARKARDWNRQIRLSVDPEKAGYYRKSSKPRISDVCTMCGKYCSIKLMEECLKV